MNDILKKLSIKEKTMVHALEEKIGCQLQLKELLNLLILLMVKL